MTWYAQPVLVPHRGANDGLVTWEAFFDRVEIEAWAAAQAGQQPAWYSPWPDTTIAVYGASCAFVVDDGWVEVEL